MSERQPVALSEDEIAAVRSWVIHEDAHIIAFSKPISNPHTDCRGSITCTVSGACSVRVG